MFFKLVPTLVNMGGHGDCGFRSVAAGYLDAFPQVDEKTTKKILSAYYQYFPKDLLPKETCLLTANEDFEILFNSSKRNISSFIIKLAYVFRQMAMDEAEANPYKYPGIYADIQEDSSIKKMRESGTYIDESAIKALAISLDISIKVSVVETGKELPLKLTYNEEAKTKMQMQLKNNHYMPQVNNPALFQNVHKQSILVESQKIAYDERKLEDI